jgi:hypothetical protein
MKIQDRPRLWDADRVHTRWRRRTAAFVAAVAALIAIAGAFHDHGAAGLAGREWNLPAPQAPSLPHQECLACKIAPPLSTPGEAVIAPGPTLARSVAHLPTDRPPLLSRLARRTPPRGPPTPSAA